MRLLQIKYFLEIAKQKSITRAAEALYVSQPALSKQMNQLEEELGVRLIHRTARGIRLTEKGELFANDCQKILEDLNAAVKRISGSDVLASGVFRIGCFDGAVIDDFMPALYRHLRSVIPDIRIKLTRQTIQANREAFLDDKLDLHIELAVNSASADSFLKDYQKRILVHREGALIYSQSSSLAQKEPPAIEDFENETLLVPNPRDNLFLTEHILKNVGEIGIREPRIEYEDNIISLMSDLKLGNGYCLLSKNVAEDQPDLLAYRHPAIPGVDVIAVWKRTNAAACYVMKDWNPSA